MSIASRITEIEQHLTDDYSVLTLAGADLTNVDKNIVNLKPTWKERLLYFINNGTDVVWNNWTKVQGTGTTLTLNNTLQAPMKIDLKGNTYQNGEPTPDTPIPIQVVSGDNSIKVEGKNLCNGVNQNYFITPQALAGVYQNNSGLIIKVDSASKYTISTKESQERYRVGCTDTIPQTATANVQVYGYTDKGGTSDSITLNTTGHNYILVNATDLSSIQVEKSESASAYTPYVSQTYPIYLGVENLFESEYIPSTTEASINAHLTKGTYTLSLEDKSNFGTNVYIQLYNGDTLITTSGHITNANSTIGFSTSSYWYYLGTSNVSYLTFTIDNNYNLKIAFANATSTQKAQLEKGSKANHYTPYGTTPIELCKIGTYQDSIVKDSGKWYLNKQIGKVVLNGSEEWVLETNGKLRLSNSQYFNDRKLFSTSFEGLICNYYKVSSSGDYYIRWRGSNEYNINIYNKDISSASDFQTWLSTHNTTVYYVIETPTNTEITGELLSQLNALEGANSYDNQTNVSQVNNDYPFIISATALEMI